MSGYLLSLVLLVTSFVLSSGDLGVSGGVAHIRELAYRARVRPTALNGFTRSTLIAGLAPHLTSQGHGPTAETSLTAHYG